MLLDERAPKQLLHPYGSAQSAQGKNKSTKNRKYPQGINFLDVLLCPTRLFQTFLKPQERAGVCRENTKGVDASSSAFGTKGTSLM